ncbi:hypothetical protein ACHMW6_00010 (plasmid) [Pseudoduganella sp. UC29_106]|uniref:hypothetical protein n=1 Tax=Pseudoduganella sp. UC29_106 TaxID=3374553 RepID=UPI00375831AB
MMTTEFDDDGDSVLLTDADKAQIEESIEHIEQQLVDCDAQIWTLLNREKNHLIAELNAGRRLPIDEEEEG